MKIGDKIKCVEYFNGGTTVGKIYTVIRLDRGGDPWYINDKGKEDCFYTSYFEVVGSSPESYIGKTVLHKGKPFKVESFTVFNKYYPTDNATIKKEVKNAGYSYVLENDDGFAPLSEVTELDMTVCLNDEYTAIIDGDNVKVGCQAIPIEKVEEIIKKYKTINS